MQPTNVITSFRTPLRPGDVTIREFLRSVHLWPESWNLTVYTDVPGEIPPSSARRIAVLPLPPTIARFRRAAPPGADGRKPADCWSLREIEVGYSYRTDAIRFSHKVFVILDQAERHRALRDASPHVFFWLDADVITRRTPPEDALLSLMPDHAAVARLHRPHSYSETGFLGVQLPRAQEFIRGLRRLYRGGEVHDLYQTHDAWVIDHVIKRRRVPVHDVVSLRQGHVWPMSPLAAWSDHLKGERKLDLDQVYGRKRYEATGTVLRLVRVGS